MDTPTVQPPDPPIQQPTAAPPQSKNYSNIVIVILLIIIGVLVGMELGETPLVSTLRTKYLGAKPTPAGQSPLGGATPTPDPTADWKTYKNASLGFELKYPSSISIDKELNDQYNRVTIFKGENLHFEVMLRKSGSITLDNYYFMDSPITRKTTLAGNPANVYEQPKGYCDGPRCSEPYIAIVTEKGSDLYHISFFGDVQLSEVETHILSTFKFIDQSQVDTTNWKTYTDSGGNFSFKYPATYQYIRFDWGVTGFFDNISIFQNCQKYVQQSIKDINNACLHSKFSFNGFQTFSQIEYQNFLKSRIEPKDYVDSQGRTWQTDMVLGEVFNFTGVLHQQNKYYVISLQSGFGQETDQGNAFRNLANQILSTFRFTEPTTYTCPANGWVDCMPGTTVKPECSTAAMAWYKANCPDFKGGAY